MPNEANRRNLKAQMDCLSDAHAELTRQAASINAHILLADELMARGESGGLGVKFADRLLDTLLGDMQRQASRICRVMAEIKDIKKNLRIT